MNILFLEDRGSISKHIVKLLRKRGHKVFHAFDVLDARSHWEQHQIACLIVDLNMDPQGLTDEQVDETLGGLLTGWIWLRDYVFTEKPLMKNRTIIYTDYMTRLQERVPSAQLEGVILVPKRGSTHPTQEVLNHVDRIAVELGSLV